MDYRELLELLAKGENERVEFKRNVNSRVAETICALSNTFGGTIIIGIADDGKVLGVLNPDDELQKLSDMISSIVPSVKIKTEILKIDSANLIIIEIKRSNHLHSYKNIAYVRAGKNNRPINPQELLAMAGESLLVSFDSSPSRVPINEADENLVREFFELRAEVRGIKPPGKLGMKESLIQIGVVNQEKHKSMFTAAGVLFFTKEPQNYFSSACIEIMQFTDSSMKELIYREKITGPIPKMVEKTFEILNEKNPKVEIILSGNLRRKRIALYPELALREAVLNAVIHRNYFDPGYIQIFLFPDKISIRNPGAFPYGVTPDNPIHKPRNPVISTLMYELGYVEKYGSGINRIKAEVEENKLVEVKYDEFIFYTEITFRKKSEIPGMDEIDKKILELLKTMHKSSEISQALELSIPAVVNRLNRLISAGIIRKKGKGKNTIYELIS